MSEAINEQALGMRKTPLPKFGPGDQIRVWIRIVERDRVRLAPFEGIILRRRGRGLGETFTVRRVTHGEGVERVFPVHSPIVDRVEVLQQVRPPRARLYFLRTRIGKTRLASAQPGGAAKPADVEQPQPQPQPEQTAA